MAKWDNTSGWQKIGDVVDAVGSGRKQLYEGREYDYVFDVDIQDGVPPLKLPYNASGEQIITTSTLRASTYSVTENPYNAAQRFLQNNDLPLSYLDQVVQFIEKNSASVNIGGDNNQFVDPYTGE